MKVWHKSIFRVFFLKFFEKNEKKYNMKFFWQIFRKKNIEKKHGKIEIFREKNRKLCQNEFHFFPWSNKFSIVRSKKNIKLKIVVLKL